MSTKPMIWADPGYDPATDPLMGAAPAAADAGPPPMPAIRMGGGAPPVFAPGPAPVVSRIPTSLEQEQTVDQQKLNDLRTHDTYDFSQHGKLRNIGHVLSKIGNIAGDIFAPATMANIPGTDLNRQVQEGSLSSRLQALAAEQSENEARDAGTASTRQKTGAAPLKDEDAHNESSALTRKANDQAQALEDTPAPEPSLATGYAHAVNEAIKAGRDPSTDPIVQHLSDAITALQKQGPPGTKVIQRQVNGKPHNELIDERSGADIKDLGESGEKPPSVNVNAAENRQFQEQERGRGLLDKAEAAYRTAQQGANTMRDMVASADAGNKMSAQVLPLEGALAITTAQGVHRINRTEVDQYAGAGNLYDKIAGELGKVASGQPIPPNIRNDIRKLTDIQEKGAYQTYKGAFDSATRRYGLKDEQALPGPGGGAGVQTFTDNGVTYHIPEEHVADFKKDHPNAR